MYITQMKQCINLTGNEINDSYAENNHAKWEFLKYTIRNFTITYSKTKAKNSRGNKLRILEQNVNLENDINNKC